MLCVVCLKYYSTTQVEFKLDVLLCILVYYYPTWGVSKLLRAVLAFETSADDFNHVCLSVNFFIVSERVFPVGGCSVFAESVEQTTGCRVITCSVIVNSKSGSYMKR